jgi:hypothetical protein
LGRRRDVALIVLVENETGVIAWWQGDAFAAAGARCHTLAVVGVAVGTATPGCLLELEMLREEYDMGLTMRRVAAAHSLMKPWKYPKRMERGRNMISEGSRMNRPTSLITLVHIMNAS